MEKKKIVTLLAGIGALLLLGGAYWGITASQKQQEAQEESRKEESEASAIVLSLAPDEIERISFTGEEELSFLHTEEGWIREGDAAFRMNENRMSLLLKDLAALKSERTIEAEEAPETYGLGSQAKTVEIERKEGDTVKLLIGMRNGTTGQLYFALDNAPEKIYLTKTALDQHFGGSLTDYAVFESFPSVLPKDMHLFEVSKGESSYSLDMPGDDQCYVSDAEGNAQRADLNLVGNLQNTLSNMNWMENAAYDCQDFSVYGLEEPMAVIHVEYADEDKPQSFDLQVGSVMAGGNYYVRLNDSKEVHVVRADYVDPFVKSDASSFWSRSYSFVSIGDMEQLTVTAAGESHVLRREALTEAEEDITWFVDETEVEKKPFTDFYYACVSVTAQERTETEDISGEADLTLCYQMKDGSKKEIVYYPYDQNFCLAVYEDGAKAALTNKLYVKDMLEKYETLLQAADRSDAGAAD